MREHGGRRGDLGAGDGTIRRHGAADGRHGDIDGTQSSGKTVVMGRYKSPSRCTARYSWQSCAGHASIGLSHAKAFAS